VTSINDKLGLKRAGKRAMMTSLPTSRADAAALTAIVCPVCKVARKAKASKTQPGKLFCTWCNQVYEAPTA
jgi:hypothetical protein